MRVPVPGGKNMFLVALELVVFVVVPVVALLFGAYRVYRFLEDHFALGAVPERQALAKMEQARSLANRIRTLLPAAAGGEHGAIGLELEELIDQRLPGVLDRQRRLLEHLARKSRARLIQDEREIRRNLASARDPELRGLYERNLEACLERLETHDRLSLASRKADAQIRSVLLGLEALEDRLVASEFAKVDRGALELEALNEDVKLLEAAYEEIELD